MAYRFRGMGAAPSPAVQQALASASSTYGVPLSLLTATAKAESGFNPGVTSSAGAQGLMQIMPANFASLGVSDPFDPQQSANAGAKYLSQLYGRYGDWNTALIAYNEGPGALASKGVYPSSQAYADKILLDAALPGSELADSGSMGDSFASGDVAGAGISDGTMVALGIAGIGILLAITA